MLWVFSPSINKTKDAVSVAVFSSTLLPPTVNSENYNGRNKIPASLFDTSVTWNTLY